MKQRKRGRPFKAKKERQIESLLVKVQILEKAAFKDSAILAGASLSTWVREKLRAAATRELERAGKPVAFLNAGGSARIESKDIINRP